MNLRLVHLGILKSTLHWFQCASEQVYAKLFESSAGELAVEVNAFEQSVYLDARLGRAGQGPLGTLAGGTQSPYRPRVLSQVLAVFALELLHEVLDHSVVEVLASQVGVARRGSDLEHGTLVDGQHRDVEGAASEVEDEDVPLASQVLVQSVGESSCGRLVDDAQHVETRNGTGVLGGLPLRVVEVSGHRDDSIAHLFSQVRLGDLLHLSENHGADLFRVEALALSLELDADFWLAAVVLHFERPVLNVVLDLGVIVAAPDQPLGVEHRVLRVHGRLRLGSIADQPLGIREGYVARRRAIALVVGDDLNSAMLKDTHAGVRCAEVDADSRRVRLPTRHGDCVALACVRSEQMLKTESSE
ncbi:hypothetical protein MRX96_027486 [Rhipicephalus microplus]